MPNYIKYSTNAQTRALKMGNFWLGPVNDGKGPTSSTGYYTSLNPPSGGFTIYLNKASNGPSIYQASNESQLVSITNQLGGTSFTTSGQCLTWYVTQTDKFCVNRDYEGIVTNGLVLNLDAGFTPSYPTSGTSWYDLGPSGNTGTLTNGPTFNSSNGGSIVFDGVDDYVKSNISKASFPNLITLSICLKYTSGDGVLQFASALTSTVPWILLRNVGSNTMRWYLDGDYRITQTVLTNNIYFLDLTYDGTTWKTYKNGVLDGSWTGNFGGYNGDFFWIGNGYAGYTNIQTYSTKLYNRALTAVEVLQNYNAMKGRFGL